MAVDQEKVNELCVRVMREHGHLAAQHLQRAIVSRQEYHTNLEAAATAMGLTRTKVTALIRTLTTLGEGLERLRSGER